MNITINGERHTTELQTLSEIIAHFVVADTPFAIAVNAAFVAKSNYPNTLLNDGDSIEVLSPMQGG